MWLITKYGFFSVVHKSGSPKEELTVRSRVRSDLENLKLKYLPELGTITESSQTDYRYRATAKRQDVMAAFVKAIGDIDYSNFKDEVAKVQGKSRAHVYGEVWHSLFKLQTTTPTPKAAAKPRLAAAFGGVLFDAQGRVLLFKPKNHFDGYHWSFPKGRPEPGETPQETALREVLEETGYAAEVVAEIPGSFAGGTTENRYFLMKPAGPPKSPKEDETISLKWASPDDAKILIAQTTNDKGRQRDLKVLATALVVKQQARVEGQRP
jgi:8-oxo-dGTP pyrophosphatase MutT (NUDIX family)